MVVATVGCLASSKQELLYALSRASQELRVNEVDIHCPFEVKKMAQIKCARCGDSIESIEGNKPRMFCNKPKCRKQASRERLAEKKRREQEQRQAALKTRWRRFHPRATENLDLLLTKYGLEAATLGTNAIEIQSRTIQGPQGKQP